LDLSAKRNLETGSYLLIRKILLHFVIFQIEQNKINIKRTNFKSTDSEQFSILRNVYINSVIFEESIICIVVLIKVNKMNVCEQILKS